ncbi:MAG: hypothetical protein KGI00_04780, partial [Candidatus Micrarchaeota archaeon]|nr:hypothetical protein [Candidatus Micrarchaeota archaeon]
MMNKYYGYLLFVIGLAVIALAFFLGYRIYNSINPSAGLGNGMDGPIAYSVKLFFLFFFASIGYKLSDMGLRVLKDSEAAGP